MRRFFFSIFLLSVFGCSIIHTKDRSVKTKGELFSARSGNQMRKRVIVLPFINQSSYTNATYLDDARNLFIGELKKTEEVILQDAGAVGLNNLAEFRSGNFYKSEAMANKLKLTGVHAIIEAYVKDIQTKRRGDTVGVFRRVRAEIKAIVEVRLISVRSGQVMVTETRDADLAETMTRVAERSFTDADIQDNPEVVKFVVDTAFQKAIPAILEALQKFSWEGRVALVKGERVYLNAGRQSGLNIGDILRIVEAQEEVYDPENSQFIGNIRGRMKGTVEVISYFGNDGAVTAIHSGSGFKENDLVEFY
jgi:TolB-like protein